MAEETRLDDRDSVELDSLEVAQTIIESLLDHTRVVSDLIALMAQALDEETQKALTQTPQWQAYLESRRRMEQTREDVKTFAEMMKTDGQDSTLVDPQKR